MFHTRATHTQRGLSCTSMSADGPRYRGGGRAWVQQPAPAPAPDELHVAELCLDGWNYVALVGGVLAVCLVIVIGNVVLYNELADKLHHTADELRHELARPDALSVWACGLDASGAGDLRFESVPDPGAFIGNSSWVSPRPGLLTATLCVDASQVGRPGARLSLHAGNVSASVALDRHDCVHLPGVRLESADRVTGGLSVPTGRQACDAAYFSAKLE